ncbi:hypothetical protein P3X46_008873 [Hevea brasiliensis]|uniref:Phosphoribosyltransferase domain-containing protein n=1 Tax=Hevea brasiliensis TaxID=3981 RepID=A0ABQ9MK30_HEVBR|nr:hypothetical protein P3X46_008873 [Hevea brasiliensis]
MRKWTWETEITWILGFGEGAEPWKKEQRHRGRELIGRASDGEGSRDQSPAIAGTLPHQPTITGEIQSPMGVASVEFIDPRENVAVVPILRAGLALAEHASSILPATKTYHIEIKG